MAGGDRQSTLGITEAVTLIFAKGMPHEAQVRTRFYVMDDQCECIYSMLLGKQTMHILGGHVHPVRSELVYYPKLQQGDRATEHALPVRTAVTATPEQLTLLVKCMPASTPMVLALTSAAGTPQASPAPREVVAAPWDDKPAGWWHEASEHWLDCAGKQCCCLPEAEGFYDCPVVDPPASGLGGGGWQAALSPLAWRSRWVAATS